MDVPQKQDSLKSQDTVGSPKVFTGSAESPGESAGSLQGGGEGDREEAIEMKETKIQDELSNSCDDKVFLENINAKLGE